MAKRICAICDSGAIRAIAILRHLRKKAKEEGVEIKVFPAGVHNHSIDSYPFLKRPLKLASNIFGTYITKNHVEVTGVFIAADKEVTDSLHRKYKVPLEAIICLNIEENYINPFSRKLREEIEEKLKPYHDQFFPKPSDASS